MSRSSSQLSLEDKTGSKFRFRARMLRNIRGRWRQCCATLAPNFWMFSFFLFFGYLFFSRGYITYIGAVRFFFFGRCSGSILRNPLSQKSAPMLRNIGGTPANVAQHCWPPAQCCSTKRLCPFFPPMLRNIGGHPANVAQHWCHVQECCPTLVSFFGFSACWLQCISPRCFCAVHVLFFQCLFWVWHT